MGQKRGAEVLSTGAIAVTRLRVAPEARRCIGCQEKSESDRDVTTAHKS
ncbi:MAG: TraR/DksA C4-type zinc finger protein [Polaromonas sp.]